MSRIWRIKKNGKGILYLNGGYVVSEWKNDLPVGKGEFWYQNGKKKINLLASKNKMVLFDNWYEILVKFKSKWMYLQFMLYFIEYIEFYLRDYVMKIDNVSFSLFL